MLQKVSTTLLLFCIYLTANAQLQIVPFGHGSQLRYDLGKGTYNVSLNGAMVIRDAYAWAQLDNETIDSRTYKHAVWSAHPISDSLGKGTLFTVTLTGSTTSSHSLQQLFFVYKGNNHFYTQLKMAAVSCNNMSALTTDTAIVPVTGDNRALLVPFDNDAWVRYDAKPLRGADFISSEITALYDNTSRHGLIIGSIDHTDWKSGIHIVGADSGRITKLSVFAGYTDKTYTRETAKHGQVMAGKDGFVSSPRFMVGLFDDWRDGLEQFGIANRKAIPRYIHPWTKAKPLGWNSWGVIQDHLTLAKAKAVVDFFHDSCQAFRTSDSTLYIDLDSFWDLMVKNGDDSQLVEFCKYCEARGFRPGVYWAPFSDWGKSARKMEGSSYNFEDCWIKQNGQYNDLDGARAMDPTHPGVRARIVYMIDRLTTCGFKMIKIDFLGHAMLEADKFYDPSVHTGMQAFRKGMEFLTDQLNDKMLVYAAISPNLATARYVNMRRIACDAFNKIGETAYTLNSTTYGWWQNRIYDYVDADHVVFKEGPAGANRARLLSAIITGSLITGDDYSAQGPWFNTAEQLLQNKDLLTIARNGKNFRPVEGNTGDQPGNFFTCTINGHLYLAIINYKEDQSLQVHIDPARWGLTTSKEYTVKELFSGKVSTSADLFGDLSVPPADAVLLMLDPK